MKVNFNQELETFYNNNKHESPERIAFLFTQKLKREGKIKQL